MGILIMMMMVRMVMGIFWILIALRSNDLILWIMWKLCKILGDLIWKFIAWAKIPIKVLKLVELASPTIRKLSKRSYCKEWCWIENNKVYLIFQLETKVLIKDLIFMNPIVK